MRKKNILGSFVKNQNVFYKHEVRKVSDEPEAYSALITFLPGCRELNVDIDGLTRCLAGAGYKWLMYFPLNENWCITACFNPDGVLQEWYFDISKVNFLDDNGMPCIDDIFLDLVIYPNGKVVTIDSDELHEALGKNEITTDDFNHAYKVRDDIIDSKWNDVEFLTNLSLELLSDYIE